MRFKADIGRASLDGNGFRFARPNALTPNAGAGAGAHSGTSAGPSEGGFTGYALSDLLMNFVGELGCTLRYCKVSSPRQSCVLSGA